MERDPEATTASLRFVPVQAWAIIIGLFVVGIGDYMVIPFFSLYCTRQLGFTLAQVGMLLTVRLWSQRGCALLGGMLADRFTPWQVMSIGLMLRCAGFLGTAASSQFWQFLICTILNGLGSALFSPAGKAALVSMSNRGNRLLILSLRSTAYNVGAAVGPLIGLLGSYSSYERTLVAAGCLFGVAAAGVVVFVPNTRVASGASRRFALRDIRHLVSDVRLLTLYLAMLCFFAFYVQIELTLPIFADHAFSRSAVTLLFIVSAATTILLQLPMANWINRLSASSTIRLGFACSSLGFILISAPLGLPCFLLGVFFLSMPEILIVPKVDSELGDLVPPALLGTVFGLSSFASSIGGALGHEGGAEGLRLAERMGGQSWFFVTLSGVAFITAIAISAAVRRASAVRGTNLTARRA